MFDLKIGAHRIILLFILVLVAGSSSRLAGREENLKKVLILHEAGGSPLNGGLGDARQLRQLLGHFQTDVTIEAVNLYKPGEISQYDFTFYIGFTKKDVPPQKFLKDAYEATKPLIWLNTGMEKFASVFDLRKRFGFTYVRFDTSSIYDFVDGKGTRFTKTEPNANVIRIVDPNRCQVLATATSTRKHVTIPYIVRSNPYPAKGAPFWYVADSPFSYATEADRYLLFADMLHDILGEDHPEFHSAIIRIEDTNPFSDPAQLRNVADLLYARHVPFLVGVIPFYVNPATGTRVAMSDKPDYVDALHYMMERGGTVVLHGTTHQYKGETAVDYEYWDESRDKILPVDSKEYVEKKLRDAINECMKNGVYPLLWETPHYSASTLDYSVFAEHFSTAIEQRLVLERLDYSQYFPYVIFKDMYGQRIYPENLGYIPLEADKQKEEEAVDRLISYAKVNLAVRDGFAAAFFHPFLDLDLLARLVDGIQSLGYTYIDLRDSTNIVRFADRVILSGSASITLSLNEQYLREVFLDEKGQVARREVSSERLRKSVTREIKLEPGWIYVAEPTEYRERALSFWEKLTYRVSSLAHRIFGTKEPQAPANVLLLYDPGATGGAKNDQSSLASAFLVLNIPLDSLAVSPTTTIEIGDHNLVLVPYNVADSLNDDQIESLRAYVEQGGNLITDFRNPVAAELGVHFLESTIRIDRVRDRQFPDELLRWQRSEVMNKFETMNDDEIMVTDDKTETPVVIGRRYGRGSFIFFGTRFDPVSNGGFSRYPYLIHYVERFLLLRPIVRREQLEMYFDPGFRHTVSIEQLVSRWASRGIRVIYVAGWHEYQKYTYDYARLIRLAHANGILVYAWLEPPQVSQKFWTEHPEWREKNYKGEDVRPSWRYPVALTDRACLDAALEYYRKLLTSYDWDGVNIAELYFEAGQGMRDPKLMTPMHPSARNQFRRSYGFDPIELFEPSSQYYWRSNLSSLSDFTTYRVRMVTHLHEVFLSLADSIRNSRAGFQVVVTVMDNLDAPELRNNFGVDVREILPLRSKYRFTLLIEDPESMWSHDPRRYEAIASRYRALLDSDDFALDLNILSFRPDTVITQFPTRIQTGTESYWLVHSAAHGAKRAVIYAESSVNPQDLSLLPYAYAARTSVRKVEDGWEVNTATPIVLQLAAATQEIWRGDERMVSIGDGKFLLPIGSYRVREVPSGVSPFQPDILETRILSITGELLSARSSQRSVELRYRSDTRCIVTLTKEPYALFVDGRESSFKALKGDGRYALVLPPGEHTVLIVAQSTVSYGVDFTSFWSSSIIVMFGLVSGGLLLILYLVVRMRYRSVL